MGSPVDKSSSSTFSSTTTLVPQQTYTQIPGSPGLEKKLRQGWASVKEDGIKSWMWQRRYLVLREHALDFNKSESATSPSLSIPLKDVIGVNRVDVKPFCFEIVRAISTNGAPASAFSHDGPRRIVNVAVKSDGELYAWIDDLYARAPSMGGVSNPTNMVHKVHVGFDPNTGGFTGLPDEWKKMLKGSAITKEDYVKNPQAVIEVLEFYSDIRRNANEQYSDMMAPPQMGGQQRMLEQQPSLNEKASQQSLGNMQREKEQRERELYREEYERQQRQLQEREQRERQLQEQEDRERREREREIREQERQREKREREREREREAREREQEQREYEQRKEEESYPQKTSTAQQPLMMGGGGGGGGSLSSNGRFNPMRAAPTVPRQPTTTSTRQPATGQSQIPKPGQRQPGATTNVTVRTQPSRNDSSAQRTQQQQQQVARTPTSGSTRQPAATPTAPVKPLNVQKPAPAAKEIMAKQERQKEGRRISNMTEAQVMEKLRSVVSPDDPNQSYTKVRKVGQGASGSVYVAKINPNATSSTARQLIARSAGGSIPRVAIKQMDLTQQPRKELIVNEISVMKQSTHPNIVNFLDAYMRGNSELWVVMEYMEGGALTDVIDNNHLEEDQIATICLEVCVMT
jgi:serine/threonine-protein kinase CLA4